MSFFSKYTHCFPFLLSPSWYRFLSLPVTFLKPYLLDILSINLHLPNMGHAIHRQDNDSKLQPNHYHPVQNHPMTGSCLFNKLFNSLVLHSLNPSLSYFPREEYFNTEVSCSRLRLPSFLYVSITSFFI